MGENGDGEIGNYRVSEKNSWPNDKIYSKIVMIHI